ncbi:MAG: hypothetical protein A2Z29_02315 [Chloroflexi bacterium RBG_16_56_11]|nr:MAG: hypothetical protein A2Z29_02315 [Chloroflexi bacterium RBG_16_56_11]
MATILVSIICMAMIVVGGMTLSQGIITSADVTSLSIEQISLREGEMTRTHLEAVRATHLAWSDLLRVTVRNTGQTRLAGFDKWDFIVHYFDAGSVSRTEWLPYTTGALGDNEWQKARIGLNGPVDFFEPDILNPQEELVALAGLNPSPGTGWPGNITIVTPNGVFDSIDFSSPGNAVLTPHTENTTIASTNYYELVENTPADSAGTTFREDFIRNEGGRKILLNENQPSRPARYLYPLIGIDEIPAATWTVYYRCLVTGGGQFPRKDGDVYFNIDILVRQADGSIRTTIATGAASAYVDKSEEGTWLTKSANFAFPGYTVVDVNDYLEIVYYGATDLGPAGDAGYMQLRTDDIALSVNEQTRIEP